MRFTWTILLTLISVNSLKSQSHDTIAMNTELEEVVVVATRSERSVYEVGNSVQIITAQEISRSGTERLSDILTRQAGIQMTNVHGSGVQLMGLSSDYVMILINGQPVSGRTAGVLDVDRISISNVKRIEILRGPSSGLYGSEALAGVINIITGDNADEKGMLELQYRRYNTTNISGSIHHKGKKMQWTGFTNIYGGSGYNLTPESYSPTAPPFVTGTLENRLKYKLNEKHTLLLDNRSYFEHQRNQFELSTQELISGYNNVLDLSNTLSLKSIGTDKWQGTASLYHSFYQNNTLQRYDADGKEYYEDNFSLHFIRPEWLGQVNWSDQHQSNYGVGATASAIFSNRYDDREVMLNYFVFYQHEWKIRKKVFLTGGLRWDGQREFDHQLNPKLSIVYRPAESWTIRASFGKGFKAPDPRQLYLNFSNPLAGYVVFGTEVLADGLENLQISGQLSDILVNDESEPLQAEQSYAINTGFTWRPAKAWSLESDAYYNYVFNLIDTRAVARKTNNQTIYSYYNISKIFTTGVHSQLQYRKNGWLAGVAFEYLKTGDYSIIDLLKAGLVFRRNIETLQTERVPSADYFGLFNRPKFSGSLQLMYTHPIHQWFISSKAVFRGKSGFADVNGNGIPDIKDEMAPAYTMIYLSGGITMLNDKLQLSAGIDNVTNFTSVTFLPSINGINPWIKARIIF